jgi:glutamine synthetase
MAKSRSHELRAVSGDGLVALTWMDLVGLARTRAISAKHLEAKQTTGLSFPSCGQALTMFGTIVENPWGALGDVRQVPIPSTLVNLAHVYGPGPGLHMVLCEAQGIDGQAWPTCTRSLLRHTIEKYSNKLQIKVLATFEHEFKLLPLTQTGVPPLCMTLEALRHIAPMGERIVASLERAGIQVEAFEPEFASRQYEVSTAPREGLRAADEAVLVREIVRDVARNHGHHATFTPKTEPDSGGSGLHIHLSLWDARGRPLLYDPKAVDGLGTLGRHFVAGILRHAKALLPFVAPGVISYLRLGPGKWSSGYAAYGTSNREVMLRLCGLTAGGAQHRAKGFNIEFRSADGLCNPYLALAAILHAGFEGISDRLACPDPMNEDPGQMSDHRKNEYANALLPRSLAEALALLEADASLRSGLPEELFNLFVALRRDELAKLGELSHAEACARYSAVY